MSKTVQRLIIFFLGIPVVIGIVFFSFLNHLPLHIAILVFNLLITREAYAIFSVRSKLHPKPMLMLLSFLLPLSGAFCAIMDYPFSYTLAVFFAVFFILLIYEIFVQKTFDESNTKIASSFFIVFYCGFLMTFISRLTVKENSIVLISLFFLMIFCCDSVAWLLGVLFGKTNRGIIAASPNKSIAGFIGAYIGAIGIALITKNLFWNEILTAGNLQIALMAFFVATAGIVGDLIESVFKRSSGLKDSGNVILGRGGALDSIDSILAAAPVYFIALAALKL